MFGGMLVGDRQRARYFQGVGRFTSLKRTQTALHGLRRGVLGAAHVNLAYRQRDYLNDNRAAIDVLRRQGRAIKTEAAVGQRRIQGVLGGVERFETVVLADEGQQGLVGRSSQRIIALDLKRLDDDFQRRDIFRIRGHTPRCRNGERQ